jgi:hypothetical protein
MADEAKTEKLELLYEELSKTSVISENFKELIYSLATQAVDEVSKGIKGPNEEGLLQGEFASRRFKDSSAVIFKSRNIAELAEKSFDVWWKLFSYIFSKFPREIAKQTVHPMFMLFCGPMSDVVAVREWLWRELNENSKEVRDFIGESHVDDRSS